MSIRYVCENCVEDDHLAEVIHEHQVEEATCSYCDALDAEVALSDLDDVIAYIRQRIEEEWCDPAEELPYEGREGGYQGEVLDTREVLGAIGWEPSCWELHEDIADSFWDEHWCKRDYFIMREDERLLTGWESFSRVVKHSRRYTFWTMGDENDEDSHHPDYTPIGTFLHEVARCATTAGLIRHLSTESLLWRVRVHSPDELVNTGAELGSPPQRCATQPNRMSPEGISMFYGAEDFETACLETVEPHRPGDKRVTGGAFRPLRQLNILDLNAQPDIPSYWAEGTRELRLILLFLRQFRQAISQPIRRGDSQLLDYVPTQAFTEYVRFDMQTGEDQEIHGLCYMSSRNGRPSYVIFAENDQCHRPDGYAFHEQLLALDSSTLRTVHVTEVADMIADPLDQEEDGECLFQ